MRKIIYYNSSFPSQYYPVDKYNLLMYNNFGYVGSSSSMRNIQLRRISDGEIKDFLFDGSLVEKNNILTWADGSDLRVAALYNEGVGGSDYDLIQNTASSQPYLDTTNWLIDYSSGSYFLQSSLIEAKTSGNSIFMASFVSQNDLSNGGVFEEVDWVTDNYRHCIYSDTRLSVYRCSVYSPRSRTNFTNFSSAQAINSNKAIGIRRVGSENSAYSTNDLVGSISSSDVFGDFTYLTVGKQTLGFLFFRGKTKGFILHDEELSMPIFNELLNHLAI